LPVEARLSIGLAIALAVVYVTTPLAIRVADRLQFYDRPVGYKGHARPTPYLGGAAVVAGFVASVVLLTGDWRRTLPVVAGMLVLWVVGTLDDRRTLTPATRVAVEILLASAIWALGLGWDLGAGPAVDLLLTAFWIVAIVNAFNLFDNMDGVVNMYNNGMPRLRRKESQAKDPLFPDHKDPLLKPLGLNARDRADLIAFLESLNEPKLRIRPPELPGMKVADSAPTTRPTGSDR
jgi:hypothetical protein